MEQENINTLTTSPKEIEFLKRLGNKIAHKRKELGYKNSDTFAYEKGINRSQYGKYESGTQDMRVSSLLRVVRSLGLDLEEFFRDGV